MVDHSQTQIIETYDTFLRDDTAKEVLHPDLVLRFGAMPVSKSLLLFLKKHHQAKHLIVDPGAGWREPSRPGNKYDLLRRKCFLLWSS